MALVCGGSKGVRDDYGGIGDMPGCGPKPS